MEEKEKYQVIYDEFMEKYNRAEVTPAEVGEVLANIAGFFPNYNEKLTLARRSFALITRDEILKTDELTGKAVTASKAEIIARASSEAFIYEKAKSHVENIEMLIASLKFLQKALETEYINSNV